MRHALFAKHALCASLLIAGMAQAQSLLDLYEAAKTHDAGYLSALSQKEATVAKADQANLLPTVSLSASSTQNNSSTATGDVHYKAQTATVSATQPLYKPALWASYQQGQVLYEQARAQLELAEQDLIIRISQAYFDVLVAHDTVALVKAQKAANSEQLAAAKRNFEVGTATITDTHEAQARYDLTLAQEIAAENDVQIKHLALSTIVGRPALTPKALRGKAQLPELQPSLMQQWVDQALAMHPGIEIARFGLTTSQLEVDKASAGHKPTLDGVVSYGTTKYPNGLPTPATAQKATTTSIGVVFNMPLFAGFSTQGRVRETLALEERARADLQAAERSVAQNTRSSFLNVLAGKSQVLALEAAEASSNKALEANQLGYQVGVRVNIDVLNAQSQLYQTRRDLAKARYDLLLADLKLRQASGVLKPQHLSAINALLSP